MEATTSDNKESADADARGILGHCSSLWWQNRYSLSFHRFISSQSVVLSIFKSCPTLYSNLYSNWDQSKYLRIKIISGDLWQDKLTKPCKTLDIMSKLSTIITITINQQVKLQLLILLKLLHFIQIGLKFVVAKAAGIALSSPVYTNTSINILCIRNLGSTTCCCWSWSRPCSNDSWKCWGHCSRCWSEYMLWWKR